MSQDLVVHARDGVHLSATLFGARNSGDLVVIHSATGVPRQYYFKFARFLDELGFSVLCYDYRGIGGSKPTSGLKGFAATMTDWARNDADGVMDWAQSQMPNKKVHAIGHSFGGQALGLSRSNARLQSAVLVGAQAGYWRLFPAWKWAPLLLLWYVLLPATIKALGYFPAKLFRLGENLPTGVAEEWARWCKSPEYFMQEIAPSYSEIAGPITFFRIADDGFAPPRTVDALARHLPAKLVMRDVQPSENGGPVGHFGFFREKHRDTLWRELADTFKTKSA